MSLTFCLLHYPGEGKDFTDKQKEIIKQQGGNKCFYCGTGGDQEIDHLTPLSRGGNNSLENGVPSCTTCNREKGDKTYGEYKPGCNKQDLKYSPETFSFTDKGGKTGEYHYRM